jgi:hypothetical protein
MERGILLSFLQGSEAGLYSKPLESTPHNLNVSLQGHLNITPPPSSASDYLKWGSQPDVYTKHSSSRGAN